MPETEVTARDGSRTWRIRYNNKSLRWFERQTGLRFMGLDPNTLGMDEITYLVAAGLLYEQADVTIDDADEFIDAVGLQTAYRAVMDAVEHDLGSDLDPSLLPNAANGTAPKNARGAGMTRK